VAIVGIDLGTTNSLIATAKSEPLILAAPHRLVPSAVRITADGVVAAGAAAKLEVIRDPIHTITGIKRFMGRRYSEVADLADFVPYNVVPGPDDFACVHVGGRLWRPEEISAEILKVLKTAAEEHLSENVDRAVITIPAYFNYEQANATRRASELAGMQCIRLVAEPTAAAFAYHKRVRSDSSRVLVVDLGGGTYDVSLVVLDDGVAEVIAVDGDGYLGGDDFDAMLLEWALDEVRARWREDLSHDVAGRQRLHEAVVQAKCDLSSQTVASIEVPYLFESVSGWQTVSLEITRKLFESLTEELFRRLASPLERIRAVVEESWSSWKLDEVLLAGGATRMPRVSQIVAGVTKREPLRTLNPDEAIAIGAGMQAGVLAGTNTSVLLLDVVAHAISIETDGNGVAAMIWANTTIPTRKEEVFAVASDEQTSVEVNILLGGAALATSNRLIGTLVLEDLTPPLGEISVTLDIDASHELHVTVRHLGSGRAATLNSHV
jgi:molecular chaperone DnaK